MKDALQQGLRSKGHLWDRHSLRMNLQRFLPSEMRPATPMPRWSSILKSFRWKVPISADVLFMEARTICVLLCTHVCMLNTHHIIIENTGRSEYTRLGQGWTHLESYNCGSLFHSFHGILYLVYAALGTPCHDVLIVLHRNGDVRSQDSTGCL